MTWPAAIPPVYFKPVAVPAGDGSYVIKPGKPHFGRQSISIKEAAARSGVSESTLMRLFQAGFIEGSQASPRKTRLFVDSLDAHCLATQDLEFWTAARIRKFNAVI